MKHLRILIGGLFITIISSCSLGLGSPSQDVVDTPTVISPTETPIPTVTVTPTETMLPPTPTATPTSTPSPQPLLLRGRCGSEYVVKANYPLEIFYGGWGVIGLDLAQQWTTALIVEITIDQRLFEGEQQPPSPYLPLNCNPREGMYWVYYRVEIPELSPGAHEVTVKMTATRALPDAPTGIIYGPGPLALQKFQITAQ